MFYNQPSSEALNELEAFSRWKNFSVPTSFLLYIYMELQKKKKVITYAVLHCKIVSGLPGTSGY